MTSSEHLIICEHCDCVYQKTTLAKHQKTLCVRCGGVLQRYNGLTVEQRLALTVLRHLEQADRVLAPHVRRAPPRARPPGSTRRSRVTAFRA